MKMVKMPPKNKNRLINPSITFNSPTPAIIHNSNNATFVRSKTPFYQKNHNSYTFDEDNYPTSSLNKSVSNQTFIYNSINFTNQGLFNNNNNNFNNINNNNVTKKRKSIPNNNHFGNMNYCNLSKKCRSISKQKNQKFGNMVNKFNNNTLKNKRKPKSVSKQKSDSFKKDKMKIPTYNNIYKIIEHNINNNLINLNNFNNFNNYTTNSKNTKNKIINNNMISVLNNNTKINNIMVSTNTTKKNFKNKNCIENKTKKNTYEKKSNWRSNTKSNISDDRYNYMLLDDDIIIINQINSLVYQLTINNSNVNSAYKKLIFKELEKIFGKILEWFNEDKENFYDKKNNMGNKGGRML